MLNKFFIIPMIFLFSLAGDAWSFSFSNQSKNQRSDIQLHINSSSYLMDKELVNKGYNLKNENNNVIFLYKNQKVSASQFYLDSLGSDKAKKLFISFANTLKNANIYLNGNLLQQRTDKTGMALIDLYRKEGNYRLELIDNKSKGALNYLFSLDGNMKLICSGTANFKCDKKYY